MWCRFARCHGLAPLPITVLLVAAMAATPWAADYGSGFSYTLEATQRHTRGDSTHGCINPDVELASSDAMRALAGSQGPAARSAEVPPEAWGALLARCLP